MLLAPQVISLLGVPLRMSGMPPSCMFGSRVVVFGTSSWQRCTAAHSTPVATRGSSTAHSNASAPCTASPRHGVVVSMECDARRLWLGRWWAWLEGLLAQRQHAASRRVAMVLLGWLPVRCGATDANPETSLHAQQSSLRRLHHRAFPHEQRRKFRCFNPLCDPDLK